MESQEGQEREQRMRQFLSQAIQCVIQAINHPHLQTPCKVNSTGLCPFGLSCPDLPEVRHEIKRCLANHLPSEGKPVCVETSLMTSDGDTMVLEIWTFRIVEKCLRESNYPWVNHLSAVLRAICLITRQLPARRFVKVQSGESHVFYYRLYVGEPEVRRLGEAAATRNVAQVRTVLGLLQLHVAHRTRMNISQPGSEQLHIVADHFGDSQATPKRLPCSQAKPEDSGAGSVDSGGSTLAFSTTSPATAEGTHPGTYDTYHGKTNPLRAQQLTTEVSDKSQSAPEHHMPLMGLFSTLSPSSVNSGPMNESVQSESTIPFGSLLAREESPEAFSRESPRSAEPIEPAGAQPAAAVGDDSADDFVLVEMRAPFGGVEDRPLGDVEHLYHLMRSAPPLSSADEKIPAAQMVSDIHNKLLHCERDIPVFDEFVRSLQLDEERSSSDEKE